jgi:hypothetical protein
MIYYGKVGQELRAATGKVATLTNQVSTLTATATKDHTTIDTLNQELAQAKQQASDTTARDALVGLAKALKQVE